METQVRYTFLDIRKEFSGRIHHLLEAEDGFRFYLDDAFVYVLQTYPDLNKDEISRRFGVDPFEVEEIVNILTMAGLLLGDQET